MARRRRLLIGLAVAVAVVVGFALWLWPEPRPPRTVSDDRFLAAAERLCRDRLPALRADPRANRDEGRNEAATARRIERAADGIDELVDDLAGLPVDDADRAEVDGWLRAWRDFVADGRRYADAVRSKDAEAFSRVAKDSRDSQRRVGEFALGNRIDACVPR